MMLAASQGLRFTENWGCVAIGALAIGRGKNYAKSSLQFLNAKQLAALLLFFYGGIYLFTIQLMLTFSGV